MNVSEFTGGATTTGSNLLVVDDDVDFAQSIQDVLAVLGYTVRVAYSHEQALEVAREFRPDVVLIDVKLGHGSGVDLILPLREHLPDVQCIMMTGYAAMDTVIEALRLGAVDYLHKPADLDVVRSAVEQSVRVVQLKRENAAAVQALHKSEQKYRRLVDGLRDEYFFYSSSPDGTFTFVSPSASRVLGFTPSKRSELFGEEGARPPATDAGSGGPYDRSVRRADGGMRHLRIIESVVRDEESGTVSAVDGMAHDITERTESQERFRQLANSTQEAIVIHDGSRILEANEVFFDLFGYDASTIAGVEVANLWSTDSRGDYQTWLKGDDKAGGELVAMKKSGDSFPAAVRVRGIPHGGHRAHVTAISDLTGPRAVAEERRRMEEQLRRSQKMEAIGQLTGGIAHDFNNMLQAILGYADLASRRLRAQRYDSILEYVEQIQSAAARTSELIRQLLLYSRGGRAEPKAMTLEPSIRQVLKIIGSTFPSNVEILASFGEIPLVRMDATQLQQVMMNLCINARDALPRTGGRILIRASMVEMKEAECLSCGQRFHGRLVEISVEDNGAGMPAGLLGKIFDPFFTTKDVGKGSGMGLAVVHGVVHEHGGHVLVSTSPGQGSRFRIFFPPTDERLAEMPKGKGQGAGFTPHQGRLLVVDDEPMVSEYLRATLSLAGYDVTTTNDPIDALARFENEPDSWDLVITDQMMPGMLGDALARAFLAKRPKLPIVLCTGYGDGVDAARAAAMNIRGFLEKPCDAEQTLDLIQSLLSEGAAARP